MVIKNHNAYSWFTKKYINKFDYIPKSSFWFAKFFEKWVIWKEYIRSWFIIQNIIEKYIFKNPDPKLEPKLLNANDRKEIQENYKQK